MTGASFFSVSCQKSGGLLRGRTAISHPKLATCHNASVGTTRGRGLWILIINHLSFQQHSSNLRLSSCVFIHIPASPPVFRQRSFVFIEIPASFVQFREVENSKVEGGGVTTASEPAA
jgi:hypothetical protein